MQNVDLVLTVLALGSFAVAVGPWVTARINFIALGLALLTLTLLV